MSFPLHGAPESFQARAAALVEGLDAKLTPAMPPAEADSAEGEAFTSFGEYSPILPDCEGRDDDGVDFADFDEDKCRAPPTLRRRQQRAHTERSQDWTHYSLTNVACSDSQSNQTACFSFLRELGRRRKPEAPSESDAKPVFRKRASAAAGERQAKRVTLHNNVRCMPECQVGTRKATQQRAALLTVHADIDEG